MFYTERIDDFQVASPTYIGEPPKEAATTFDIIKWYQSEPWEVLDLRTGEKVVRSEFCYVIGWLKWDVHECCFRFESCGLRWLEEKPTQKFIDRLLEFAEEKARELEMVQYD